MVSHEEFDKIWKKPAVKIGVITIIVPMLMCFLPNVYLFLRFGAFPPLSVALKAWAMIATIFGAFYIVELVSYYPILGLTGTYITFLTGNMGNLRVPCSAVAQEVVGVKPGTQEAEIVSTLGLTDSVVTNLFFTTLAAVAGATLLAIFPEPIAIAFKQYTVAAIFGAVFGQFTLKYPALAAAGLGIPLLLFIGGPAIGLSFLAESWIVIIGSVFGTIGFGRLLYKKGLLH